MILKDKILEDLRFATENINWFNLLQHTTNYYAEKYQISRNTASEILNDFFNQDQLIKVNSRPVLFFKRNISTNSLGPKLSAVYNSVEELRSDLEENEVKPGAFRSLIGHNGSLNYAIEQCKSAVTYPDGGLSVILIGATGVGKSLIAEKTYEYGVE